MEAAANPWTLCWRVLRQFPAIGQPMSVNFEELDFRPTPMGVLSLRRRRQPSTGIDIFEIKLGDAFLMSSLFTAAEIELARLGLAALERTDLDVVVGGLGSATPRKRCSKIQECGQ